MKTILFQGDSITDCGRGDGLGLGYAFLVASELGYQSPGAYQFINKGVSGNRIVDLYARIKADIINLKPDYLSILIGVNDVWHELSWQNGVDAEKFEKLYCMLIEEIQAALPQTKIMIMEPFCLRGPATDDTEECPQRYALFRSGVEQRAQKAKAVADKYHLPFIALQAKLDAAAEEVGPTYWLEDGVHPRYPGHYLLKREWIKAFKQLIRNTCPGTDLS